MLFRSAGRGRPTYTSVGHLPWDFHVYTSPAYFNSAPDVLPPDCPLVTRNNALREVGLYSISAKWVMFRVDESKVNSPAVYFVFEESEK